MAKAVFRPCSFCACASRHATGTQAKAKQHCPGFTRPAFTLIRSKMSMWSRIPTSNICCNVMPSFRHATFSDSLKLPWYPTWPPTFPGQARHPHLYKSSILAENMPHTSWKPLKSRQGLRILYRLYRFFSCKAPPKAPPCPCPTAAPQRGQQSAEARRPQTWIRLGASLVGRVRSLAVMSNVQNQKSSKSYFKW